ncbi:IPT/TIG domain-containing protein [Geobacter sp.]|uniref:IPT/TIG domain-containing protein n=1 Tax=Geobacter sp. TaxID=46610 RepID=UPI0027BABB77|nr:IPT/TIG domain-containing protein [Geobacter sp.]
MKQKVLLSAALTVTTLLGAAVIWANVPPPPVNQTIGIFDTQFGQLTRPDCLTAAPCHVSDEILVPRHHNLVETEGKQCLDCHRLVQDPNTGIFGFADFRNCLQVGCHISSPHHVTTQAQQQNCQACHGSLIDNPGDGHFIPTYAKSSVTPNTKWFGNNPNDPKTYGGCAVCHQADLTTTPRPILSNQDTHHGTGIGFPPSQTGLPMQVGDCSWCHGNVTNNATLLDIRKCEQCHGIKSLHNIQVDTPAAANVGTIVPGQESAGYGHIGNNSDCFGCHGFFGMADTATAPATIPSVSGVSKQVLAANVENVLTVQGQSFVNSDSTGSVIVKPVVTVTNGSVSLTVQPVSITDTEVKVTVPALVAGNYELRIDKQGTFSNPVKLVVIAPTSIKSASISGRTVTITGAGFGQAPPADYNSGMGVIVGAANVQAQIVSWSDAKIVVSVRSAKAGEPVTVKTLNGGISKLMTAASKKQF